MESIQPSYNLFLVGLSYLVSVFGSFTGLLLVNVARSSKDKKMAWLLAAATALGGGAIWTMHFIGMLAYDIGMPISYDLWITLGSMVIAVVFVAIGLFFVGNDQKSWIRLIVAGFITGLGVASMHYSGMYAMKMPANMSYDPSLFGLSIVIAIVAATVALWLAFNLSGNLKMMLAALVMGVAVCGMHYTGMFAMSMEAMDHSAMAEPGIKPITLGLLIFCSSMLLLVLCLIVTMAQLSRRMYEELEMEDDEDYDPPSSAPSLNLN